MNPYSYGHEPPPEDSTPQVYQLPILSGQVKTFVEVEFDPPPHWPIQTTNHKRPLPSLHSLLDCNLFSGTPPFVDPKGDPLPIPREDS